MTQTFMELGLDLSLLESLEALGFEHPTEIQGKAIPVLLQDDTDFIGLAQTGTGKTAAFGLPMLHRIDPSSRETQALILSPTRELCMQIAGELKLFSKRQKGVRIVPIYGGAPIDKQRKELASGAQVIVATPGRLQDMINRGYIDLSRVEIAILDEADEMLNMGFLEPIEEILSETPETKNTWLFSATMPDAVARIAKKFMTDPVEITVGRKNETNEMIDHRYYLIDGKRRFSALKRLVDASPRCYAIVFCNTRIDTQKVAAHLIELGYPAAALHGDLSQSQRDLVMTGFRTRQTRILVATDIAARGLDVQDITHVFHYKLPDDIENYTHRSGRTARAGKEGVSMALVTRTEARRIPIIQKTIRNIVHKHTLPTGKEVVERQLADKLTHLEEVNVEGEIIDRYWPFIQERLKDMGRDELLRRVISLEFHGLMSRYESEDDDLIVDDRTEKRPRGVRYFVQLGARDGFNWGTLKDTLAVELMVKKADLSRVEVKDSFSFFNLTEGIQVPSQFTHNGRSVRVNPATQDQGGRGEFEGRDKGKKKFKKAGPSKFKGKPRPQKRNRR